MIKGYKHSQIAVQKKSETMKRLWSDPEYRKKMVGARIGHYISEETKRKLSETNSSVWTDEMKDKASKLSKSLWGKMKPEDKMKRVSEFLYNQRFCSNRPNSFEKRYTRLLNSMYPEQWEYVGNGVLWIDRKNPDIINRKLGLIIELYGTYWHRNDDPEKRISFFRERGYETLVIWESEKIVDAKNRIIEFVGKNLESQQK